MTFADPGRKPSLRARQQKAASIMLDKESPWPVRALVLDTFTDCGGVKTDLRAFISEASPMEVEGARRLRNQCRGPLHRNLSMRWSWHP